MPVILTTQEAEIRGFVVPSQPGQTVKETMSKILNTQKKKRAGGVTQVVENLSSKHEA
jgi:hypothetical protein